MKYTELKEYYREKINNQKGMFFAFNKEQFEEGMQKIGLDIEKINQIAKIGGGGYILKSEVKNFNNLVKEQQSKIKEKMLNDYNFARGAIKYEMFNIEYCYNESDEEVLSILSLTFEDLEKNKKLTKVFLEAKKEYYNEVY